MEAPLDAAGPEQPDRPFHDGDRTYEVSVWPAMFPLRFSQQGGSSDLGAAVFEGAYAIGAGWISSRCDDRWKVAVSPVRRRPPSWWRVVAVEFFDTEIEARSRQRELLQSWRAGQYADAVPLSMRDLRRARVESKP